MSSVDGGERRFDHHPASWVGAGQGSTWLPLRSVSGIIAASAATALANSWASLSRLGQAGLRHQQLKREHLNCAGYRVDIAEQLQAWP